MKDDDVKRALDAVFHDEPPLRLHRDEVLQQGRARLLRRRSAVVGGVAAVSAAVAFSASLLAGATGASEVGPAGSGSSGTLTGCSVVSVVPTVTTAPPKPCEPTTPEHARELTAALADGDVLPAGVTAVASGKRLHPDPLTFVPVEAEYSASADLVAADGQRGALNLIVGGKTSKSARAVCDAPATCEFLTVEGGNVQITTTPIGTAGEVLTMVHFQRADGTQVYAGTSNVSMEAQLVGRKALTAPTIDRQPLTVDQLVKIVTLPGLTF
ncbi:MAG TPA: hypothetical protein VNO31_38445 [Umezawaea sp.]|nr:hypothetical protein [Umezawaea sp.]